MLFERAVRADHVDVRMAIGPERLAAAVADLEILVAVTDDAIAAAHRECARAGEEQARISRRNRHMEVANRLIESG